MQSQELARHDGGDVDAVGNAKQRRQLGDDSEQRGLGWLGAGPRPRQMTTHADHGFSRQPEQPSVNGTLTYAAASHVPTATAGTSTDSASTSPAAPVSSWER